MTKTTTFDVPTITTPIVRDVVTAYRYFYGEESRRCICDDATGTWPHLFHPDDESPVVCQAHEWLHKRKRLQGAITTSGLSLPVPKREPIDAHKQIQSAEKKWGDLYRNPLLQEPDTWACRPSSRNAQVAGAIALELTGWRGIGGGCSVMEHVVFLVHNSTALSLMFQHRDKEIEDVILYAPVLIFWNNRDGRSNGRLRSLIDYRQYGYAFVLEG